MKLSTATAAKTYYTVIFLIFILYLGIALPAGSSLAVLFSSNSNVYLSSSGITLAIASGSNIVSYAVSPTALTLNLDSTSTATVESNNLYTLTNDLNQPTQCSGTNYSYVNLTASTTTTVTITPNSTVACAASGGGGGGGGGGAYLAAPIINSFTASVTTILPGGSVLLSWSVTGATSVSINPTATTSVLSDSIGSLITSPASTTTYTLTATNSYNQTSQASLVVAVSGSIQPPPSVSSPPIAATGSALSYCLVNNHGTFSLILSGIRHPIANPGLLYSWGYSFDDAVSDGFAYESLPTGNLLLPNDGALIKDAADRTVFLVSSGQRHGFASASIFQGLGYKFNQVLVVPSNQLQSLPIGPIIANSSEAHLAGSNIIYKGTIYYVSTGGLYAYPSVSIYNSWNLKNDFSRVLPANNADLSVPIGGTVSPRSDCKSP